MSAQKLPSYVVQARNTREARITVSLRISQRVYLHTREKLQFTATVEAALREALQSMGVDLSIPHEQELIPALEGDGYVTFAEAKEQGFMDARGNFKNPGIADESDEGAVL